MVHTLDKNALCSMVQTTISAFMKEKSLCNIALADLMIKEMGIRDDSTKEALIRNIRNWRQGSHLPSHYYMKKLIIVLQKNGDNVGAKNLERIEKERQVHKAENDKKRKERYRKKGKELPNRSRKLTQLPPFLSDKDIEVMSTLLPGKEELLALNGYTANLSDNDNKEDTVVKNYMKKVKKYGIKRNFWKELGKTPANGIEDLPIQTFISLYDRYSASDTGRYEMHELWGGLMEIYIIAKYLWENSKENPAVSDKGKSVYAGIAIINELYELGDVWDFATLGTEGEGSMPYICEGMNEIDNRFDTGIYGRTCRAFTQEIKRVPVKDCTHDCYYIYVVEDEDMLGECMDWFDKNMGKYLEDLVNDMNI